MNKSQPKPTILVVEDSDVFRKFITSTLEKQGYHVVTAVNGAAGLETVKSTKPDLILLDCEMPVMNGLEMCKKLKEDESTEDIPIIFLTAVDTPQNIVDCFEMDAENYLSKPISGKLLTSQIEAVLKQYTSA